MEKDIGAEVISKLEELNIVLDKKAIETEELRKENRRLKENRLWSDEVNVEEAIMQLKEMIVIIENHIERQNGK